MPKPNMPQPGAANELSNVPELKSVQRLNALSNANQAVKAHGLADIFKGISNAEEKQQFLNHPTTKKFIYDQFLEKPTVSFFTVFDALFVDSTVSEPMGDSIREAGGKFKEQLVTFYSQNSTNGNNAETNANNYLQGIKQTFLEPSTNVFMNLLSKLVDSIVEFCSKNLTSSSSSSPKSMMISSPTAQFIAVKNDSGTGNSNTAGKGNSNTAGNGENQKSSSAGGLRDFAGEVGRTFAMMLS